MKICRAFPRGRARRAAWARPHPVILRSQQRQRPEVGRRPEENDQEQQPCGQFHRAGDRRPGDEGRDRARRAADDDVLGRPAFQEERVHEHVKQNARQRDERRSGRWPSSTTAPPTRRPARCRTPALLWASPCPREWGGCWCAFMIWSMSRSKYMFSALADPDAEGGAETVEMTRPMDGDASGMTNSVRKPVTSTSNIMVGLVRAKNHRPIGGRTNW